MYAVSIRFTVGESFLPFWLFCHSGSELRPNIEYVPSNNIIADGFTKALPIAKWPSFLNQVGLIRRTEPQLKEVDVNELQERLEVSDRRSRSVRCMTIQAMGWRAA
jgi:hypothetical protein